MDTLVMGTFLRIEIILLVYMGGTAVYLLIFAIASLFPIKQKKLNILIHCVLLF